MNIFGVLAMCGLALGTITRQDIFILIIVKIAI